MLNAIVASAMKNRLWTFSVFFAVSLLGAAATVDLPIETDMSGIQGVEEVRSLSKYGLSQVVIVFQENTNIYFARQLVSEKLQGIRGNLPDGVSPELAPVTTGLGEVLMYVVEPKPGSKLASQSEKERLLRTWPISVELTPSISLN